MSYVFVIDQEKRPLDPVHPGRARKLLSSGKAAVYRRFPFVLILKHPVSEAHPQPLRLKIDPGSKTTGLAVLNDTSGQVLWAAELVHRGEEVHQALQKRAGVRRGRRSRHTRYRAARFSNRRRKRGWLAPSLCSRMQNVQTWTRRLMRWCPLGAISYEAVRFDTQAIQNPEIKGVAYQHGTLANQQKGSQTAQAFGFPHLQAQALQPLKDAAAVNSTRWALYERLKATGLPIEVSTGGQTKWNRKQRGIPKSHWLDAVCVGPSTPERVQWQHVIPLLITARGRQCRQLCNVDGWGFPRSRPKGPSKVFGFQTGDMVQAVVTRGKRMGTYVGRVAIKTDGYFKITGTHGMVEGIHGRHCP